MPTPVVETIAEVLEARLKQITTANNYNQDAIVERPKKSGTSPQHNLLLVQLGDCIRQPDLDFPGNPPAYAWMQWFLLTVVINPPEESEVSLDTLLNQFRSDVEKAVTDPVSVETNWHNFASSGTSYAIDAEWGDVSKDIISDSMYLMTLQLGVTYRVSELDPYTVR